MIIGRVEGANENPAGQLEMYQRALAMSNANALTRNGRIDLLRNIFLLESSFDQYAAALRTLAALKDVQGSEEAVDRLSERAGEIKKILDEEAVISASATIANPCDCDAGEALWQAAFLSVSSFNNAGFSILPDQVGVEGGAFINNLPLLGFMAVLIVLGSIGWT
ncbi:MAG: hypothetical protein IH825_07375, partial [Candidatus Marinimicrobia bacterium]|nr:hypothetical protein [Candidatus Neomarinimicrobiota bacterium]